MLFRSDDLEKIHHQEALGVLVDLQEALTQALFKEDTKEFFESKQKSLFARKFADLSKLLGTKEFLFNQITFSDFKLFAQVHVYQKFVKKLGIEDHTKTFSNLQSHNARIASLPGVKEYLSLESTKNRITMPKQMVKFDLDA